MKEIDAWEYRIGLGPDSPIDRMESSVYVGIDNNGRRIVLKKYDGYRSRIINLKVLQRYLEITNKVKALAEGNPVFEADLGCKLVIVPIERIGRISGTGCYGSISEYIPGDNLMNMKGNAEKQIMIMKVLGRINRYLQQALGEKNIRIDSNNVKLSADGKTLYVTDVCGVVAGLSPDFYGAY